MASCTFQRCFMPFCERVGQLDFGCHMHFTCNECLDEALEAFPGCPFRQYLAHCTVCQTGRPAFTVQDYHEEERNLSDHAEAVRLASDSGSDTYEDDAIRTAPAPPLEDDDLAAAIAASLRIGSEPSAPQLEDDDDLAAAIAASLEIGSAPSADADLAYALALSEVEH